MRKAKAKAAKHGRRVTTPEVYRVIGRKFKRGMPVSAISMELGEAKQPDARQFRRKLSVLLVRGERAGELAHDGPKGNYRLTPKGRTRAVAG